jgi:hypothetical protein
MLVMISFAKSTAGLLVLLGLAACSSSKRDHPSSALTLFNGRNLDGWRHVLADPAVPRDRVWTVRDGAIECKGEPLGYLCTERQFMNFRLSVEYRWKPGAKPGNSGIFSRINGSDRALPRCVEVQLMHGSAGDVLGLQGMKIASGQERFFHITKHELAGDIDGVKKLVASEAEPGQWNRVEVQAEGGVYRVWINGLLVNEVQGVETLAGPVGLQSEGGEIEFRRVVITALP